MADMTIFPTGLTYSRNTKAPLESNRLFDTLALAQAYIDNADQTAYVGMTLAVTADENSDNNGLYFVSQIADASHSAGILTKIGSGTGAVAVETFAEALALAGDDNIGQIVYLTADDVVGEGEAAVTYSAGPYIVAGEGVLSKLGTTGVSGDIAGDVETLKSDVNKLKTTVGDNESGLVKDVADLKSAVNALPETIVTDVKVDGTSVVSNGVAEISLTDYAKSADVAAKSDFEALALKVGDAKTDEAAATGIYKLIAETEEALKGQITSIPKFAIEVVENLPEENISDVTVYLVKDKDEAGDLYTEYIHVNGTWENLGKQTVDLSSYSTTEEVNGLIATALASYVTSTSFTEYKNEIVTELGKKANASAVYTKDEANSAFVSVNGYVAYSEAEKSKLDAIAENAQVNVLEAVKVKLSDGSENALAIEDKAVVVDLSSYAKSSDIVVTSVNTTSSPVSLTLSDGVLGVTADVYSKNDVNNALAAKLTNEATVNGKPFEEGVVVVTTSDIKLGAAVSKDDEVVYSTDDTIQGVIASLSTRIDNINAIVDGQITGVASVSAGNGIAVSGEASAPVVSVKVSGNTIASTTEGISVKVAAGSALSATDNGLDILWSELN